MTAHKRMHITERKASAASKKPTSEACPQKNNINKMVYSKFLSMNSEIKVAVSYDRIAEDTQWDGLKAI